MGAPVLFLLLGSMAWMGLAPSYRRILAFCAENTGCSTAQTPCNFDHTLQLQCIAYHKEDDTADTCCVD